MRLPAHLRRSKHGVLHLRLTVPEDLRPVLGKRELKRSLKIRDLLGAHRLTLALAVKFGPYFEDFWRMIRKGYDPKQFDPNDSSTWPASPDQVDQYKAKFNILTGECTIETEPDNEQDHRLAMEAMRGFCVEAKSAMSNPVLMEQQQKREARALEERAILEEVTQNAIARKTPSITVGAAVKLYKASLVGMKEKTQGDYMFAVEWFERFVGAAFSLRDITDAQVNQWKNELVTHYTAVRDKKLHSKVAKGHLRPDPVAGLPKAQAKPGSVDKIISRAHRFMLWCQEQKHWPLGERVPTAGKNLMSHAERKKLSFYKEFVAPELRKIFDPANLLAEKKPHEFWMPLLCLFTGARIGELSQMYHDDLYQDENDYWLVSIRDKEGFQRLKTDAACRTIPLHPMLIELGFLDYLADVREAVPESDRVFPYLRHDKTNGFGDVPSEAFARYLDSLGIHEEAKTAHSFRKTSNNRLKANGVEVSIRCQLVGHEQEGVNEVVYSTNISMAALHGLLRDKLVFSEIDFSPLKYRKGRFIEILKSEMLAATTSRKRPKKADGDAAGPETKAATAAASVPVGPAISGESSFPPLLGGEPSSKSERLANHLVAKAARMARAPKKRGRPPKGKVAEPA